MTETAEQIAALYASSVERPGLELAILRHMEHHIAKAVAVEREACAKIAEMHENYCRDYSRDVFARRIAEQIRRGDGPSERELEFARSVRP